MREDNRRGKEMGRKRMKIGKMELEEKERKGEKEKYKDKTERGRE